MTTAWALHLGPRLVGRYPQLLLAGRAGHQTMVHQLEDLLFIQAYHHIIADDKSWYSIDISPNHIIPSFYIFIHILGHIVNLIFRKKLLRSLAMRSSLGRIYGHFLHNLLLLFHLDFIGANFGAIEILISTNTYTIIRRFVNSRPLEQKNQHKKTAFFLLCN